MNNTKSLKPSKKVFQCPSPNSHKKPTTSWTSVPAPPAIPSNLSPLPEESHIPAPHKTLIRTWNRLIECVKTLRRNCHGKSCLLTVYYPHFSLTLAHNKPTPLPTISTPGLPRRHPGTSLDSRVQLVSRCRRRIDLSYARYRTKYWREKYPIVWLINLQLQGIIG